MLQLLLLQLLLQQQELLLLLRATPTMPDAHQDRVGTVEGDGRQNHPGSVAYARELLLPGSTACC